jgi:osmotically-inducible protein OsmY
LNFRTLALITLLPVAAASLPACIPLVAAGAAVGVAVSIDRRTVGAQVDDRAIQLKANQRLKDVLPGDELAYASVYSHNRQLLITGLAPTEAKKARADQIARGVDTVRAVHNELQVGAPDPLTSSTKDTITGARVRAALIQEPTIESNAVRVITEARTVYLMGIVTRAEGERIARSASTIRGVDKVVTVFDYVTEEELAAIQREQTKQTESGKAPAISN